MAIQGVVLAGGASSRMGRDKAYVEIDGRSMLSCVADTLAQVTGDIVVVGRTSAGGYASVPDSIPHKGPLAGVVTALRSGASILAVAVDQPFVQIATLEALLRLAEDQLVVERPLPVVPHSDGFAQVTCAFYPANFLRTAEQALGQGSSLRTALGSFGYEPWTDFPPGEDGRSWFSVDTPEGLQEGLRRFQPPM